MKKNKNTYLISFVNYKYETLFSYKKKYANLAFALFDIEQQFLKIGCKLQFNEVLKNENSIMYLALFTDCCENNFRVEIKNINKNENNKK